MGNVILIGYMCAGKTTVGKSLAKQMGCTFYDLDWYIEERFRKHISEIFEEKGEDGFREIERNMLHEVAEFENIILACGGGTPCFFDNIEYMNKTGKTVFLDASPDTIIAHLKISRTIRPLLQDKTGDELKSYIIKQLEMRRPFYQKAQYTFNVDILDNFDKVNNLVTHIREQLNTDDDKMEN